MVANAFCGGSRGIFSLCGCPHTKRKYLSSIIFLRIIFAFKCYNASQEFVLQLIYSFIMQAHYYYYYYYFYTFILIQEIFFTESLLNWKTFAGPNSGQLLFLYFITQTLKTVNVDLELNYLHLKQISIITLSLYNLHVGHKSDKMYKVRFYVCYEFCEATRVSNFKRNYIPYFWGQIY